MKDKIVLINANPYIKEYMSSYGLEILKSHLDHYYHKEFDVIILNPFHLYDDPCQFIRNWILENKPVLIGISVRNIDNALTVVDSNTKQEVQTQVYAYKIKELISMITSYKGQAFIIIGGAIFSHYPKEILEYLNIPYGVVGPGEEAITKIAGLIKRGKVNHNNLMKIPGMVSIYSFNKLGSAFKRTIPIYNLKKEKKIAWEKDHTYDVCMSFPNQNYRNMLVYSFPVRTHTGCGQKCIYCVESLSGSCSYRPIDNILDEIESLIYNRGCKRIFFTNAELNLPDSKYVEKLCNGIIYRNLHQKIHWTSHCNILPFTENIARLLNEAGCDCLAFSIDSFSNDTLKLLKKNFTLSDIEKTVSLCEKHHIIVQSGIFFGSPGESKKSIDDSLKIMKDYITRGHRLLPICGYRIYPKTELWNISESENNINVYKEFEDENGLFNAKVYCCGMSPLELLNYVISELGNYIDVNYYREQNMINYSNIELYIFQCLLSINEFNKAEALLEKMISHDRSNTAFYYFIGEYLINKDKLLAKKYLSIVCDYFSSEKKLQMRDIVIFRQTRSLLKKMEYIR